MSYATGEAALATLIDSVSGWTSANIARQDWRILGRGINYAAILRPGPFTIDDSTLSMKRYNWRTIIEVWARYIDDTVPTDLQGYAQAIITLLNTYPTMGGLSGVIWGALVGGGEMQERTLSNGSLWAVWEIYYDWSEEINVSYLYS